MHPIEWLRAIARSDDLPHSELAGEAAGALAALADEPLGLVPACRRLLDRHPGVGPLWWACGRLLVADDLRAEARSIQTDLEADQVGLSLALDLPPDETVGVLHWSPLVDEVAERRPDVSIVTGPEAESGESTGILLVEAWAAGDRAVLVAPGAADAVAVAQAAGPQTWLTISVGRRLPEAMFRALRQRLGPDDADLLTPDLVSRVVEPLVIGGPCPPELLRPS